MLLCAFVALVNVLHKTDGSYVNRPFFRSGQDVRESIFSQKDILPRYVFCFFSSRKEIVPLSFLFRRKNGQLAREAQPLRRTDAGTSCVVVGRNTTRVCLPPPPCLCPCPPRLRACFPVQADLAKENHLRKSYYSALLPFPPTCYTKRTVHIRTVRFFRSMQDTRESVFSQINQLSRSVFCFFSSRKEIVPFFSF